MISLGGLTTTLKSSGPHQKLAFLLSSGTLKMIPRFVSIISMRITGSKSTGTAMDGSTQLHSLARPLFLAQMFLPSGLGTSLTLGSIIRPGSRGCRRSCSLGPSDGMLAMPSTKQNMKFFVRSFSVSISSCRCQVLRKDSVPSSKFQINNCY
jgi:hypothetical protein